VYIEMEEGGQKKPALSYEFW